MKQTHSKLLLLLILRMVFSFNCNAQESSSNNYQWLQGEWRNALYGDILDLDTEGLRFLKNGLVFDKDEEEYFDDYEMPESIQDLEGYIINCKKVPYNIGFILDSISGQEFLALVFDYQMNVYPFEKEQTYLGLDTENKLLYYFNQFGERVFLNKFSDLTYEEQLAKELNEKQEQLHAEIASNQFGWLHGQWDLDFVEHYVVNIDDDSVKFDQGYNDETTGLFVAEETIKRPIKLQYRIHDFTHEVELVLDVNPWEICVDKENQNLYTYYDFDQHIGFEKVSAYTQDEQLAIAQKEEAERQAAFRKRQIIKYSTWGAIGVVGVVLLLLLFWWIKKLMPKIKASTLKATDKAKEKAKEASDKAREKAKEMSEKSKESKDKLVDKSKELMEKSKAFGEKSFEKVKAAVKDNADDNQEKKTFTPWLISLLGVYSIIFFDIYIGLLLLIPALFYLILRKVNPEKLEKLVNNTKVKLQPLTSKPLLKHGLVALLAGIVVLRTLGIIPGLIIIGLSVVFLALTKFAPTFAQKIDDGCAGICDKLKIGKIWQNNWVKVAVFALLLLVPILGVRPGQSVYGIAQSDNETSFYGSTSGSSHHVHSSSCVNVRFENSFFSGNTFYLGEDVMVKNLCGHKINKLTIEVYIHGEIPSYERRTKTVHEYNLMPGKEVRAGSLRMSEDNIPEIISISVE